MIIIATCWTTAGNVRPGDASEVSPWLFEDRVKAVAEAGFTGFGLLHADVVATRDRIGYPAMKSMLADHGIAVVELEVVTNWFTDDARRDQFEDQWRDFAEAAEAIDARHIKAVGDMSADPWPLALLADKFADLCHRAEDVGTAIVLEPMPFSSIADLPTALEVVNGASAGRLLLDVWHVERGQIALADVAALAPEAIGHIEIDDAATQIHGSLWEDTVDHRLLCGQGDLDIDGFLAAVRSTGYTGTYGVEIISAAHRERSLHDAISAAYTTTVAALVRAPSGS